MQEGFNKKTGISRTKTKDGFRHMSITRGKWDPCTADGNGEDQAQETRAHEEESQNRRHMELNWKTHQTQTRSSTKY